MVCQKVCQDLLEEYFGGQRERGRHSDNRTVHEAFGYNDPTSAAQRNIAPVVRDNVAGRHKGEHSKCHVVSEEPHQNGKKRKRDNLSNKMIIVFILPCILSASITY